jgi:hypothetical protein
MSQYKTLRTWAVVLTIVGLVSVVSATVGVVAWAIAVEGTLDTLGVILIGGPLAILFATWPIALGQAMRAIANLGDSVTFTGLPETIPADR